MALLAHSCRVAGWLPRRGFGAAAAARQSYAAGALMQSAALAPRWLSAEPVHQAHTTLRGASHLLVGSHATDIGQTWS